MDDASIFAAASKIESDEERKAFLDEACGENAELRAEVEALLQADKAAGSFLNHSPVGQGAPAADVGMETVEVDADTDSLPFLEPCDKPGRIGLLGHYEIIDVIGRGGMGVVLRAWDPKLNRVVAIKVIAPELASVPMAVRRFLSEAQKAAAVVHDHVVTIHAVDDVHRPPFLVMEFIEGQTLQQKVDREGALDLAPILRIGTQIAEGLAAAHQRGLIHRDIKPANILLENGVERVKITDFGLARAVNDAEVTRSGQAVGTPQFMSPEQARGEKVDHRSDLFSLGAVLYTMCTGRSAFRAESALAVMRRVCEDAPRPISEINRDIPEWLTAIIDRLLAKAPEQRFESAAEVAELLSRYLAYVQTPSQIPLPGPLPAMPAARSKSRRWRATKWIAVGTAGVIVLGATAWILQPQTPHPDAVQWSKSAGGNDHWYVVIVDEAGVTLPEATQRAAELGGHLATITSKQEDDFVIDLVNRSGCQWHQVTFNCAGPWIGAIGDPTNGVLTGWRWVNGEPMQYSNWLRTQPNVEEKGAVHYAKQVWGSGNVRWNDKTRDFRIDSFVVEFDDVPPQSPAAECEYAVVMLTSEKQWPRIRLSNGHTSRDLAFPTAFRQKAFLAPGTYQWETTDAAGEESLHAGEITLRAGEITSFSAAGPVVDDIDLNKLDATPADQAE